MIGTTSSAKTSVKIGGEQYRKFGFPHWLWKVIIGNKTNLKMFLARGETVNLASRND